MPLPTGTIDELEALSSAEEIEQAEKAASRLSSRSLLRDLPGVGLHRLNAFFLLVERPEVYNLPAAPNRPAERIAPAFGACLAAVAGLAVAAAGATGLALSSLGDCLLGSHAVPIVAVPLAGWRTTAAPGPPPLIARSSSGPAVVVPAPGRTTVDSD